MISGHARQVDESVGILVRGQRCLSYASSGMLSRRGWSRPLADGFQGVGEDEVGHHPLTLGGGVDAVILVELGVAGHPLQKEGDEGDASLLGHRGIDGGEGVVVPGPHVPHHLHPGQHHRHLSRPEGGDYGGDVLPDQGGVDPPEAVVGARLQDDDVGDELHDPVHPS